MKNSKKERLKDMQEDSKLFPRIDKENKDKETKEGIDNKTNSILMQLPVPLKILDRGTVGEGNLDLTSS